MILKHSEELLDSAKTIFGDNIVTEAYISIVDYGRNTPERIKDSFKYAENKIDTEAEYLSYDAEEIFIKINGRLISFTNSEWGSISLAKENELKILPNENT